MTHSNRLILWDIDHTLLDPNGEARLRVQHFWEECIVPVLVEAQAYIPTLNTTLDTARMDPPLLKQLAEPEHCCNILFAIILDNAFGGAVQRWTPVHDDIFAAIFGPNRAYAADIIEIMQEFTRPGEHYYPGILELLAELQRQGCRHALITHRDQPDAASSLSVIATDSQLHSYIESRLVFTQAQGAKSSAEGRKALIRALRDATMAANIPLIPEQTVMIGDMAHDAELALDLGCDFILAAYGHGKFMEAPQEYEAVLTALHERNEGYAIATSIQELRACLIS